MALYIRQLTLDDMQQCIDVEAAAFPPGEAATPEKIEYRLTVSPELCYGLFVRAGQSAPERVHDAVPVLSDAGSSTTGDTLAAHTISTRAPGRVVRDDDMKYPEDWKTSPSSPGAADVGHRPDGPSIALHSLAVAPAHQKSGFGRALMVAYLREMKKIAGAERVIILTYDHLLPYYQKLGFEHYGRSECNYAGVAWHDLGYEL